MAASWLAAAAAAKHLAAAGCGNRYRNQWPAIK